MKLQTQSRDLKTAFRDKINQKVLAEQQQVQAQFKGNPMGSFINFGASLQQARNQFMGTIGEMSISILLSFFPNDWVMFNNAVFPNFQGNLTEIDTLIIGTKGIFLIEVKTWKGSFSAYQDKWKMRKGSQWIPLDNSPSSQSVYHLKVFCDWLQQQNISIPPNSIYAPVVFTIARWIGVTDCAVPVLKSQLKLRDFIKQCPDCLSLEQIKQITTAVKNCELNSINSTHNINKSPNFNSHSNSQKPKQKPILRKKI